jgi:hypothetical protein
LKEGGVLGAAMRDLRIMGLLERVGGCMRMGWTGMPNLYSGMEQCTHLHVTLMRVTCTTSVELHASTYGLVHHHISGYVGLYAFIVNMINCLYHS